MNRRELMGRMGVAGAAALALDGLAFAAQDQEHHHDAAHEEMHEHIRTIGECALLCNATAHHCLEQICNGQGDAKKHAEVHELTMDCQAFCVLTVPLMVRHSKLAPYAHAACAEACRACAEACDAHQGEEIVKRCAEACRACEKVCREMGQHQHHEHDAKTT